MEIMTARELEARKSFRPPRFCKDDFSLWELAWRLTHSEGLLRQQRREDAEIAVRYGELEGGDD